MRLFRGKVIILLSGVILAATFGTIIFLAKYSLPDPSCANRQQLFYWLACKDLSKQPWEIRLTLANRLEQESCEGLDWRTVDVSLDELQQNMVWDNISLLLKPWLMEKAKSYGKLSVEKRRDYVDRLIDVISAWRGIEKLLPSRIKDTPGVKTSSGLTSYLCSEIDRIVMESGSPEREQIGELWQALKLRWLIRAFS